MERIDIIKLIDFITIHRPNFVSRLGDKIYKNMVNDWERIMGPYDYEDIFNNLENFLKEEKNYGKEPDAYQLIRGILTKEDKKTNKSGRVSCQFCGRWFNRLEVYKHEDRCRSVKYLDRMYRKLLNRQLLNKKELYEMNDKEFDEKYIKSLEYLLPHMTNILDIRGTTNTIETYYGREPKYSFYEVMGKDIER